MFFFETVLKGKRRYEWCDECEKDFFQSFGNGREKRNGSLKGVKMDVFSLFWY